MARLPGATFADQIRAFREKTTRRLDVSVGEIVKEVGERVIARTPVDTGLLISNYNYSVGSPDTSVADRHDIRTLNNLDAMPAHTGGLKHFVSNGVHYGPFVEWGTSRMAPRAMIGLTVVEFSDIARSAVAEAQRQLP